MPSAAEAAFKPSTQHLEHMIFDNRAAIHGLRYSSGGSGGPPCSMQRACESQRYAGTSLQDDVAAYVYKIELGSDNRFCSNIVSFRELSNPGIGLTLYGNSCSTYEWLYFFVTKKKLPLTRHLLQLKILVSRKSRATQWAG